MYLLQMPTGTATVASPPALASVCELMRHDLSTAHKTVIQHADVCCDVQVQGMLSAISACHAIKGWLHTATSHCCCVHTIECSRWHASGHAPSIAPSHVNSIAGMACTHPTPAPSAPMGRGLWWPVRPGRVPAGCMGVAGAVPGCWLSAQEVCQVPRWGAVHCLCWCTCMCIDWCVCSCC